MTLTLLSIILASIAGFWSFYYSTIASILSWIVEIGKKAGSWAGWFLPDALVYAVNIGLALGLHALLENFDLQRIWAFNPGESKSEVLMLYKMKGIAEQPNAWLLDSLQTDKTQSLSTTPPINQKSGILPENKTTAPSLSEISSKIRDLDKQLSDHLITISVWMAKLLFSVLVPFFFDRLSSWWIRTLPWKVAASVKHMLLLSNSIGTLTHKTTVSTLTPYLSFEPVIFGYCVFLNVYVFPALLASVVSLAAT